MAVPRVLITALDTFTSACLISGVSLTALILFSRYSKDRGVATFTFNIIEPRAVVGPVHGPSALADSTAIAHARGLDIPKSISFGTERICFDLEDSRTCHLLTGNITTLFPAAVTGAQGIGDRMDTLWTVVRMVNMTSCATASLTFFCTFGLVLCILPLLERSLALGYQVIVRAVLTLSLGIPLLISTISVHVVQAEVFRIVFLTGQGGRVQYYSLGGLCSSLLMGISSIAAAFLRVKARAVAPQAEPRSFFDKS